MSDPVSIELENRLLQGGATKVSLDADAVDRKWPVWLRILVIVGMGAALWGLILTGIMYLFN